DTGRGHKYEQDLLKHTEEKTIPRLCQRPKKDPTKDERIRTALPKHHHPQ
ncbi:10273_t:CDS:2, partial [Gigaspora rosea]